MLAALDDGPNKAELEARAAQGCPHAKAQLAELNEAKPKDEL